LDVTLLTKDAFAFAFPVDTGNVEAFISGKSVGEFIKHGFGEIFGLDGSWCGSEKMHAVFCHVDFVIAFHDVIPS
jgi:hypothetical protein